MFDWLLRKEPEPQTCKDNPGQGVTLRAAFKRGEDSWTQETNVVDCLANALKTAGHRFSKKRVWIKHSSGLILQPRIVEFQPRDDGGVRTVTTIECSYPGKIPDGIFEYQHRAGNTLEQSATLGFGDWLNLDFPTLHDALLPNLKQCTGILFDSEINAGTPLAKRRVVLGPVAHTAQIPLDSEEHSFCPCCFFTRLGKMLDTHLKSDGFFAVRFLAIRNQDGSSGADCRINGLDWTDGKQALIDYAKTWPLRGFEFRKQYIVIQNR
jgi:hypothetical protein